jgi:hypothetical protein
LATVYDVIGGGATESFVYWMLLSPVGFITGLVAGAIWRRSRRHDEADRDDNSTGLLPVAVVLSIAASGLGTGLLIAVFVTCWGFRGRAL